MPRGVPKSGSRQRRTVAKIEVTNTSTSIRIETDTEIEAKLNTRFGVLGTMAKGCTNGTIRSLIVSGPAGLGKSFVVENVLSNWDPDETRWSVVKGYIRPVGLFKLLYQHRSKGQVIVFDDADAVFSDETCLNLLKAVCDSGDRRRVSYITETSLIDEETAEVMPKSFDFNGTIIFISNYDFDHMIDRGHKLAPHFQALISRSHYVDLAMKTKRDYIVRIRQVVSAGLLRDEGLSAVEQTDVLSFVEDNMDSMRELSLRMALKVGTIRKLGGNWKDIAKVTCVRNA